MSAISACMIVKNEASHIRRVLTSLSGQVDEVVVADTGSTDDTVAIAQSMGACVEHMEWRDDFAAARNFCIEHATGDYILMIDADEEAPENLCVQLEQFIKEHPRALGRVQINNDWRADDGTVQSISSHITRFFPNLPTVRFVGAIHEQIVDHTNSLPRLNTGVQIRHYGYALDETYMEQKSRRNLRLLLEVVEADPTNGYYLFQLGKAHEALHNLPSAAEAYKRSVLYTEEASSYHPELLMSYLYALKRLGRPDELWPILMQALQMYPDFPDVHFFMAGVLMHFRVPMLDQIKQCYETCLLLGERGDKYPSVEGTGSYLAYYNLGAFYEALGNLEDALSMYAHSLHLKYQPAAQAIERVQRRIGQGIMDN